MNGKPRADKRARACVQGVCVGVKNGAQIHRRAAGGGVGGQRDGIAEAGVEDFQVEAVHGGSLSVGKGGYLSGLQLVFA